MITLCKKEYVDQNFALRDQSKKNANLVHDGKIHTTTKDNLQQHISAV